MIVGDPQRVAIEAEITQVFENSRALGFFLIHLGGFCYGVRSPDATMLTVPFNAVRDRLTRRGRHVAPFANHPAAGEIASAFRDACYAFDQENNRFFGMSDQAFSDLVWSNGNHLVWAPADGDEAFDDGSCILQFDVDNRVRLIGFRCGDRHEYDPHTLRDVWLDSDDFYAILSEWLGAFAAERQQKSDAR